MSSAIKKRKWDDSCLYDPDPKTTDIKKCKALSPKCDHLPCGGPEGGVLPCHFHFDLKCNLVSNHFGGEIDLEAVQSYEKRSLLTCYQKCSPEASELLDSKQVEKMFGNGLALICDISYRRVLMGWLMEVCSEYKFASRTLCLAIELLDRYMQAETELTISRENIQLMGVTSLWIAAKYEEIYPFNLEQASYITDHAYSKEKIKNAEIRILSKVGWNIESFTVWDFLWLLFDVILQCKDLTLETLRQFVKQEGHRMALLIRFMLCLPVFVTYSNAVKATAILYVGLDTFLMKTQDRREGKQEEKEVLHQVLASTTTFLRHLWSSEDHDKQFQNVVYCQAHLLPYCQTVTNPLFQPHDCLQYESGSQELYKFIGKELTVNVIDWKRIVNCKYPTWSRDVAVYVCLKHDT